MNPAHEPTRYWSKSPTEMLAIMGSHREGLSSEEVKERFKLYGRNILTKQKRHESLALFLERFRNPLIWILIFAAVVALIAREWLDALVVLAIVFL